MAEIPVRIVGGGRMYSVGIYARLSVEGEERKRESIDTQIAIAKAFLLEQDDMVLYDSYADIGKSGKSFVRQEFERMMQDVRRGKINCIIVKDLSRFGRNHIEAGNYIEKIFPFLGVRFIAVADHFDSMDCGNGNEAMGLNLKNLINEMYAKDIAVKVSSGKQARQKTGNYIGGIPPYGFLLEREKEHRCLVVEKETADIVRGMYECFLSGKTIQEIKVWLYEQGIHSPRDYRCSGYIYRQEGEELREWTSGTIRAILHNPVYVPVIIPEDSFARTVLQWKERSRNETVDTGPAAMEEDPYEGILFCGDCGRKMSRTYSAGKLKSRNESGRYYYSCPASNRIDDFQCGKKSISSDTLTKLVRILLWQELALSVAEPKDLMIKAEQEAEFRKKGKNHQLAGIDRKIEGIRIRNSEWYLRYREGELGREKFIKKKESNRIHMAVLQKEREDIIDSMKRMEAETAERTKILQELLYRNENGNENIRLSKEIIQVLIQRISVYSDQRVSVTVAFQRRGSKWE